MPQHFLLSPRYRDLPIAKIARLSEAEAYTIFKESRWSETNGEAHCPKCETPAWILGDHSKPGDPRQFRCKACRGKFTVTSGTLFHSRKLDFVTLLIAMKLFLKGAKGTAATQISAEADISYKSAWVLAHKMREGMMQEQKDRVVSGTVEVDGSFYGGYVRPANLKSERADLRLKANRYDKEECVVVARERGANGKSVVTVVKEESDARTFLYDRVGRMSHLYTDEGTGWTPLHAIFKVDQVRHKIQYSNDGVCTNQAESIFSRLRRSEMGTHHRISGAYLFGYASDCAWREDNRRLTQQERFTTLLGAVLSSPQSRTMKGYWQRRPEKLDDDAHALDHLLGRAPAEIMKWREFREPRNIALN